MAKALWQSDSVEPWNTIRQEYADIIKQHATDKLQDLNSWYEQDLPKAIAARSPNKHITQQELVKLVDWKLTHGKWRPRLLDFAKAATEQQVQGASSKAFALLSSSSSCSSVDSTAAAAAAAADNEPARHLSKKARKTHTTAAAAAAAAGSSQPLPPPAAAAAAAAGAAVAVVPSMSTVKAALECLTVLKGVGPATASALLAAVNGSCPFMGDEALEAALGQRDYTVKMYMLLVEALRSKAESLNAQTDKGARWSAVLVERCLHAAELQHKTSAQATVNPATSKSTLAKGIAGVKRKTK